MMKRRQMTQESTIQYFEHREMCKTVRIKIKEDFRQSWNDGKGKKI